MAWHDILGHDDVVERFRLALRRGRLASSFLFVGPPGTGKRTFAVRLAQAFLCPERPEVELDPCGGCPSCAQVTAGTHPDLEIVGKPKDKASIPLELLIGDKEHRGRAGLCRNMAIKPSTGRRKIAVIDDADHLNIEGANSLLKTLEEPPPGSILILISTSPARQLPTIRSRCQLIRFRPLPAATVAELLVSKELVDDPEEARRLARFGDGGLEKALELADEELWSFREQFYQRLSEPVLDSVPLAKTLSAFVDKAGKAAAARRARLRRVVAFAIDFYRQFARTMAGAGGGDDRQLQESVDRALARLTGDEESVARCLDRCLEAAGQLDRNVNQTTFIECWLDDLAAVSAG